MLSDKLNTIAFINGVSALMPNQTPKEDFDRFEKFIDGMEDIEFDYWIRYEATKKQKALARELREEVTEEEAQGVFP